MRLVETLVGVVAALAVAGGAVAQTTPSPTAMTLAKRYVADVQAQTMLQDEGPVIADYLVASTGAAPTSETRQAMVAAVIAAMRAQMPAFLDRTAAIYAGLFTEAELRDIVAFYESSTGRSFIAKSAQASQPMAEMLRSLGGQIQADARARFCVAPRVCAAPGAAKKP